jgi:tRNA A-37 threonylcarbamoyl transferase component Bud32
MKGRLRLDKLAQSIEAFLVEALERAAQEEEALSTKSSSDKSSPRTPSMTRQASGPLYFQAPKAAHQETSPGQLQHEIEAAVPLSDMLLASSSSNNLTNLVPMRGSNIPGTGVRRGNSMPAALLLQPELTSSDGSSNKSGQSTVQTEPAGDQQPQVAVPESVERRRRTLVNRQATSFGEPEEEHLNPPIDFLTVASRGFESSESNLEDRIIPLIPFDELMLIETLGMGRVSTIYRAAWQQRRLESEASALTAVEMVALKVATVNQDTCDTLHVDELRREADIAAMLKHPNVCDLVGVAADAECFCLAYEFCEGGSLLGLLSENSRYYEYLPIALDIANGMAYLHSRQVIHRDLKPSNVLLTRDHRAKIADFGMSVANTGQELTAETGTYRYMAPEVIRHESYSSNADVYSFGILLWQLITRYVDCCATKMNHVVFTPHC